MPGQTEKALDFLDGKRGLSPFIPVYTLGIDLMKDFGLMGIKLEPTLLWGGTPLFSLDDAIKLLGFCEQNDAAVLGIEGFKIAGGKRVPDMDCIADFSTLVAVAGREFPTASREAAKLFIESIADSDVFLEFVLVKA